jgi:hypothetical protein
MPHPKTIARILPLLWWPVGIGALAVAYSWFDLPGFLIGLFVEAAIVTANRRKEPLGVDQDSRR